MSSVRLIVSDTESGDEIRDWDFDGSQLIDVTGVDGEPDLTMTIENKNYMRLVDGDVTAQVAYMQGLLKSTGDTGVMLDLLAADALRVS